MWLGRLAACCRATYNDEAGRRLPARLGQEIALAVCDLGVTPHHRPSGCFHPSRLRPALGSPASDQATTACQSSAQQVTTGGTVKSLFSTVFQVPYPCGPDRCSAYLPQRKAPHGLGCGLLGWTLRGRCCVGFTPLRRLPAAILRPQAAEPRKLVQVIFEFKKKISSGLPSTSRLIHFCNMTCCRSATPKTIAPPPLLRDGRRGSNDTNERAETAWRS